MQSNNKNINTNDPFSGLGQLKKNKGKLIKTAAATALTAAAAAAVILGTNISRTVGVESVWHRMEEYPLAIYFPDCGSAGCAMIRGDADILIDCGREKAQFDPCETLSLLGADTIDLAVLTHPDSDHIGAFPEVIEKVGVKRFLTCEYSRDHGGKLYAAVTDALAKRSAEPEYAKAGDTFDFGEMKLTVISPMKLYEGSNDNSVVLRLEYGEFTALFTGDISNKAERDILSGGYDVSADLLYVAHHGSASSSSDEFLAAVSPKVAVISVEESASHPAGETISSLMDCCCEIYRTDLSGGVAVVTDGKDSTALTLNEY